MLHHIDGMAGRQLNEYHEVTRYSKQWEEQPLSTLLVWAMDYHQKAHMPTKGIL